MEGKAAADSDGNRRTPSRREFAPLRIHCRLLLSFVLVRCSNFDEAIRQRACIHQETDLSAVGTFG